jgi:peptidoglycan/xylan/chitin deacetylase (PgdA/CDA1 family)
MKDETGRFRWHLKKGARRGLALACWGSGRLALHNRLGRRPRMRVLTYHRFGTTRRDPFCVRVQDFERQMAWLARHRLAVSLADVQGFLSGTRALADGSVLVSVDDGSPTLCSYAFPILQRHRIPAVAFVPAGELTSGNGRNGQSVDTRPEARITWNDLATLAEGGLAIGSHAWTHRSLGRMSPVEVREQAVRSREALEQRIGRPVTAFAYPFGTRADYNTTTAAVLREVGYTCAFTSQHGAIRSGTEPFALPRVKVEGGEGLWLFRLLVRGALDDWRWVDRTLWRLQEASR